MKWADIRSYYAVVYAAKRKQGLTQKQIAARGNLCGQNAISKLLENDRHGPCVETLCGAIEGLGITVPDFFLALVDTSIVFEGAPAPGSAEAAQSFAAQLLAAHPDPMPFEAPPASALHDLECRFSAHVEGLAVKIHTLELHVSALQTALYTAAQARPATTAPAPAPVGMTEGRIDTVIVTHHSDDGDHAAGLGSVVYQASGTD